MTDITAPQDLQTAIDRLVAQRCSLSMQEKELDVNEETLAKRRADLEEALVKNEKALKPLLTQLVNRGTRMTIDKRTGFDWKCEAALCESIVTHSSDRVPPEGFVTVKVHRGDLETQSVEGHACGPNCAASLAQELYGTLAKYRSSGGPAETIQEIVEALPAKP